MSDADEPLRDGGCCCPIAPAEPCLVRFTALPSRDASGVGAADGRAEDCVDEGWDDGSDGGCDSGSEEADEALRGGEGALTLDASSSHCATSSGATDDSARSRGPRGERRSSSVQFSAARTDPTSGGANCPPPAASAAVPEAAGLAGAGAAGAEEICCGGGCATGGACCCPYQN